MLWRLRVDARVAVRTGRPGGPVDRAAGGLRGALVARAGGAALLLRLLAQVLGRACRSSHLLVLAGHISRILR